MVINSKISVHCLMKSGQHDRNPVTTKNENSREVRDNGHAAGEQARNIAMVQVRKPVKQVGAGRRGNREVRPPSGEFVRENL